MIDIEKLKSAKFFIDYLANGRNPFGGEELPTEDIVNDVRCARWLFYISGVLDEVIQSGIPTPAKNAKRIGKVDFYLTDEMKANFRFSDTPISVSEIVRRITDIGPTENVKKFPITNVMKWLASIGLIEILQSGQGKTVKLPTKLGEQMGISRETRYANGHFYYVILYNKEAQEFIVDNVDAILAFDAKAFDTKNAKATDCSEKDDSIADKSKHCTDTPESTADSEPESTPDNIGNEASTNEDECTAITEAPTSTVTKGTSATTNAKNSPKASEKVEKSCLNCKFSRSGECFPQKKICAEFELAYTVDEDERNAWPNYGDATALKRGERR